MSDSDERASGGRDAGGGSGPASVLEERVLGELLAARKAVEGLSPVGMAACPTITGLLGDGDPLVAFTRLQDGVLAVLDQDDDALPVQAAAYSLGLASGRATHLGRLNDFGADFGFEARQARRYSDRGVRRLARLVCSSWVVRTVPVCQLLLAQQPDGTLVVMVRICWQWFVDMRCPQIRRLQDEGRLVPFVPEPVFTPPPDPVADPEALWLERRLEQPLELPALRPGRDIRLRISWPGEIWPRFSTTIAGPLPADTLVDSDTVGNAAVLGLRCTP